MANQDFTAEELATEEWRAVVRYEGFYSVSSLGRVRRDMRARGTPGGRILRLGPQSAGYVRVGLSVHQEESRPLVHALVAEAFHGRREAGMEVNHINGVKTDNRAANLEWVTRKENAAHAVRTGLFPFGDRNGARRHPERLRRGSAHYFVRHPERIPRGSERGGAKLTEDDVRSIRSERAVGTTLRALAVRHSISASTVDRIVRRLKWAHVK